MEKFTLEKGKTIGYKSKKGITYYVCNDYGNYLVWVEKGKYIHGSNRYTLVPEYRKPTKEIKDHIVLG